MSPPATLRVALRAGPSPPPATFVSPLTFPPFDPLNACSGQASHALAPPVRTNVCLFATTPLPSPMDVLQTLAVALGLAALSGYSLYLTVFLTGLAVHFDWIHLAPQYPSLWVLAHPPIISLSPILFVVQFFVPHLPCPNSP